MKTDIWILENIWLEIPKIYTKILWFIIGLIILLILWIIFGTLSDRFIFKGYIKMEPDLVLLHSKYDGLIQKIFIKNGQHVLSGQPLIQINNSSILSLKSNPKFNMEMERLNLLQKNIDNKQKQLSSLKILLNKGYVTQITYQHLLENLRLLKERKAQLKINIINMQEEKNYTIYAPITGTLQLQNIKIGQYVDKNFNIGQIMPENSKFKGVICVPTEKYNFIHRNKKIFLQIDAYPYRTYGTFAAVITDIDFTKVTNIIFLKMQHCYIAQAKLLFENKEVILKPGMKFSTLLNNTPIPIWEKWFLHGIEYV